jgi:hypothetical protein
MTSLKPLPLCNSPRLNLFCGLFDTAETLDLILIAVSAVSLTPRKLFQRYQWHRWKHHDREMKTIIGISTTKIFSPNFSGVKNDFESPYLILKITSSKTISWVNILIRCNYFKQKKLRNSKLHFGDFRSDYLGEYEAICETVSAC